MSDEVAIVIAWPDVEHVHDGQPYAADLGTRPRMVAIPTGRAVMWLRRGTLRDVERAEEYAAEMRREDPPRLARVFVYETSERDPLGRARRDVVDATSARSGR